MKTPKVGKKLYWVLGGNVSLPYTNRREAREHRDERDLILEVELTPHQQKKLQAIVDDSFLEF